MRASVAKLEASRRLPVDLDLRSGRQPQVVALGTRGYKIILGGTREVVRRSAIDVRVTKTLFCFAQAGCVSYDLI